MFNILHKAMLLLASRLESISSSRQDFYARVRTEKDLAGIDRRKFLQYTGAVAAALAAPSVFDFGRILTSVGTKPILQGFDERFLLTELKYIKPSGDSIIQILYADALKQIMDEQDAIVRAGLACPPSVFTSFPRVSGFEISRACY